MVVTTEVPLVDCMDLKWLHKKRPADQAGPLEIFMGELDVSTDRETK